MRAIGEIMPVFQYTRFAFEKHPPRSAGGIPPGPVGRGVLVVYIFLYDFLFIVPKGRGFPLVLQLTQYTFEKHPPLSPPEAERGGRG
jgi:hypothetical protein